MTLTKWMLLWEKKAQELNYAVKTSYQAHAEAELMQFLLQRIQQNSERYTHILGVGCSRRCCKEYNCLLKLYLGANYHEFTAAMHIEEESSLPNITNAENDLVCIQTSVFCRLAGQKGAVSSRRNSNKYYLPTVLQKRIKTKTGLGLDFSNDRFTIKEEARVIERRERKRKVSASVLQVDQQSAKTNWALGDVYIQSDYRWSLMLHELAVLLYSLFWCLE